ncbi:hypothetical protein CHS0354_031492 [Potamilus streckersoni]|uniref:Uncharacterized protein n=1 Tax=Potamilus streckersoni TaxID=2493646 RepID=A0AAE0SIC1_9BIVA|nr:hypothetical protein CHS0354_031492 [Potamilus streckersoni]
MNCISRRHISSMTFVLFLLGMLSHVTKASPIQSYQNQLDEKDRQDIMTLAAGIIKIVMAGSTGYIIDDKRNAGTVDSLYNLPHLFDAGRR